MRTTTERDDYVTQLRLDGLQANGHAIQVCGPVSGHCVKSIAFCQDEETAELIVSILNDYLATLPPIR